jgi:hypothetical protein
MTSNRIAEDCCAMRAKETLSQSTMLTRNPYYRGVAGAPPCLPRALGSTLASVPAGGPGHQLAMLECYMQGRGHVLSNCPSEQVRRIPPNLMGLPGVCRNDAGGPVTREDRPASNKCNPINEIPRDCFWNIPTSRPMGYTRMPGTWQESRCVEEYPPVSC